MKNKSEIIKKRKETLGKSLKQVADLESTETHIVIDYEKKKLRLYTSKATVMNRLQRQNFSHAKEDTVDGQVLSRSYELDTKNIGKLLRTSIFKFD